MMNEFNNPNYPNQGTPIGSVYAPQYAVPKNTQPLTEEQQRKLQKQVDKFSTALTEKDVLESYCTHRTPKDGMTLYTDQNDNQICTICGEVMHLERYTPQQVEEIVDKFVNLLDNIKAIYFDIPEDVVKEFFQIIPYCKRVPKLYALAVNNYEKYVPNGEAPVNNVNLSSAYNAWMGLNNLYGGNTMGVAPTPAMNTMAYQFYNGNGGYQTPPQMTQPFQMQQPNMQPYPNQYMTPVQMQQNQMLNGQNPMYETPQSQAQNFQQPQMNVQTQQQPVEQQPQVAAQNATSTAKVEL